MFNVGGVKILGKYSYIHPTAEINVSGDFIIGDYSYIGPNTKIMSKHFKLGDYAKIHDNCLIYGYKECEIGHNLWVGNGTIIDTIGGVKIGNNCGIGAYSQLWTHIRYGDTLEGCRWDTSSPMFIEDDVWFVGHCIVSPIRARSRSMAMVGSVVTKDMEQNHVYAGVPAKDMTERLGPQFKKVSVEEKYHKMRGLLDEFSTINGARPTSIEIIKNWDNATDNAKTYFNVADRQYTKRMTAEENHFMNFLLPVKAKFTPKDQK